VQFLAYGFIFLCLYLLLRIRHDQPFWDSMAWEGATRGVPIGLFSGPLLALVIAALGLVLAPKEIDNPFRELMRDRLSIILIGIFATTLGPLCEELAFRGFFQPLFSRTFGTVIGILLANLPFALMHGPQYAWSWQHLILVGLAGMTFGAVRHYFKSTAAAVGMHATYNLTFFSGFVIQRGNQLTQW
jgi:membrane protease YdiL (CAAX protease family)